MGSSDGAQLPGNASDDWAERRLKIDMERVSRRLLVALIWRAYPMHHLKDIALESPDGEIIEFTSEQTTIYGKHVAEFCKAQLKQQLDSNPEQFEAVLRYANRIEGADDAFNEAVLVTIRDIYPDRVFAWLNVAASLDPASDNLLFKLTVSFKPEWGAAMMRDLVTVLQDFGMERAMQIKRDKHWEDDYTNFPEASDEMLAKFKKP